MFLERIQRVVPARHSFYRGIQQQLVERFSGNRVLFHHVPKCAGSSVYRQLIKSYIFSHRVLHVGPAYRAYEDMHAAADRKTVSEEAQKFREYLLLYYLHQDIRCIAGHVRFSEPAYRLFSDRYTFVTTLREPVAWFISWYFYNVTAEEQRWQVAMPIDEFVETEQARHFGAGYAHFFSGLPVEADAYSAEAIERAKSNIGKMHVVGFVDQLPAFQAKLRETLGISITIPHDNKARIDPQTRSKAITPAVVEKIRAISAANLEIYAFARQRFG